MWFAKYSLAHKIVHLYNESPHSKHEKHSDKEANMDSSKDLRFKVIWSWMNSSSFIIEIGAVTLTVTSGTA